MSRIDEIRARLDAYTHGMTLRHPPGSGWLPAESARICGELQRAAPDDLAYLLAERPQIIAWLRSQAAKAQTKNSAYLDTIEMMYREIADAIERGDHRGPK